MKPTRISPRTLGSLVIGIVLGLILSIALLSKSFGRRAVENPPTDLADFELRIAYRHYHNQLQTFPDDPGPFEAAKAEHLQHKLRKIEDEINRREQREQDLSRVL